jgi:hypothetical protein
VITRRDFVHHSAAALGGALLGGCAAPQSKPPASPATKSEPATKTSLPLLKVSGGPYATGFAMGRFMADTLRAMLSARAEWYRTFKAFARSRPDLHRSLVAATKKHAPAAWEEMRGLAAGAQFPQDELEILHFECEYEALRYMEIRRKEKQKAKPITAPGCSTLALRHGGRMILCHNEDNYDAFMDRMALVRLRREGKPEVLSTVYPGFLGGVGPWINDRGLVMTNNYIAAWKTRPGVGVYFLMREAMHARTLDEAVAIYTHPERSYANHFTLGSAAEGRLVSLEVATTRHSLQEIDGLQIHTNHLLHPTLKDEPQDQTYVQSSSMSRLRVLSSWREGLSAPRAVSRDEMVRALSLHEGRPYSPCRHPEGKVKGATLFTAAFDVSGRAMRIYKGNPCQGVFRDYAMGGTARSRVDPARPTPRAEAQRRQMGERIESWWASFLTELASDDSSRLSRLATARGLERLIRLYGRERHGLSRLSRRLKQEKLTWAHVDGAWRLTPKRAGDYLDEGEGFVMVERGGVLLLDGVLLGD